MTIEQTPQDTQPPDPLIAALECVDAWERGEMIDYSPESIAFMRRLQQARIGRLSAVAAGVEAEL